MRYLSLITLCAPLLLSCGEPASAEPAPRGVTPLDTKGSRLEPMSLAATDGTRFGAYGFFWDKEKREMCQVYPMNDAWVCVPPRLAGQLTADTARQYVQFSLQR